MLLRTSLCIETDTCKHILTPVVFSLSLTAVFYSPYAQHLGLSELEVFLISEAVLD